MRDMESSGSGLDSGEVINCVLTIKDACDRKDVGGKAFNISRMARAGFSVPEGFCITTKAYDLYITFNQISKGITSDRIREGVMPPLVSEAIQKHLDIKGPFAVRSSSTVEDLKSASSAGQYTSVLNVTRSVLLDAVKECWASLWSSPAVGYRKRMGIHDNIKMAVLVQEMVPATVSGVLFTGDTMTVEAVWGLGDLLVGGKVTPDHFVIKDGTIVERTLTHKEVMSVITPNGGVRIREVPEHLQDIPVLTDSQLRRLCALGKKVEDLFGCQQDIEWALSGNKIILLQARPITVEEPIVWSRANAAETMPGYSTYLSRVPDNKPDDIVLGLAPLLKCFGIKEDPESLKFRDYIYGHTYLNMTAVERVLGQIPGLSPDVLYQSLGHAGEGETATPTLKLSTVIKLLPGTLRVIRFFLQLPKRAQKVIPLSQELMEDINQKNLQELSPDQLEELVWEMYERNSQVFQVHSVTALAVFALFGIVKKIAAKIGEEGTENVLTIGLEGMSSSQLGVEMWKLAQSASQSPRVAEIIMSENKDILNELKGFSEGKVFLKKLEEFLELYGDRCSQELELSMPRWRENPSFVLSMVATYLKSHVDPVRTMEEQKQARLKTTDNMLKRLSWNPLKFLFVYLLKKTQQYIVVRENLKTTWVKGVSVMRVLYIVIAEKLVEKGILENKEDIFYLKMTEVSELVAGNLKKNELEELIEERKREKEKCENLEVPEVIVGVPPSPEKLHYTVESKSIIEGTGCSHGVATGRARVIHHPEACSHFEEGDIVVTHITDPGWSPLFVTAGALVMELGGTLSHGVIIAREYGIPAVVGVKNATKVIKDGEVITVDGNKGLVYVR